MNSKTFNYQWLGKLFSNVGDIFSIIGLISLVYKQTSSPFFVIFTSLIMISTRVISNAASSFLFTAPVLKMILKHAQIGKTFLTLVFILLFFYFETSSISIIFIFTVGLSFLDGFLLPGKNAYVPFLIKREELMTPNGFLSITDEIIQIVSWTFGGVICSILSAKSFFILLLVLYTIGTFIRFKVPIIPLNSVREKQFWFKQLREGWREVKENKLLKKVFILNGFQTVSNVISLAAVLFLLVEEQLRLEVQWWGLINSSFLVGSMLGSFMLFRNQFFFAKYYAKCLVVMTVFSAFIIFIFGWTSIWQTALLLSILFGVVEQIKTIMLQTILQRHVLFEKLGKVYAVHGLWTTILLCISGILAGVLMEKASILNLFKVVALMTVLFLVPLRFMSGKISYLLPPR